MVTTRGIVKIVFLEHLLACGEEATALTWGVDGTLSFADLQRFQRVLFWCFVRAVCKTDARNGSLEMREVASPEAANQPGFLQEVKETDAPNRNRFVREVGPS